MLTVIFNYISFDVTCLVTKNYEIVLLKFEGSY